MTAALTGRLVRAAALADVPPGAVVAVEIEGHALALVNHHGSLYAIDGDCTHAAGPLGDGVLSAACLLQCPWHGAVFDVRTGEVRRGPARKRLRTYEVEVSGGDVLVAIDPDRSGRTMYLKEVVPHHVV